MVSSFSVEDATRKGPPQCRPICVPFFLATVLYVQLLHGLATLLLLLGIQVPPDKTGVHLLGLVGASFATTARSHPVMDDTSGPVMFLSNHRSWGDFVVDCTLLGSPSFISRTLVALGIPFTAAYGFLRGWIWFFQRGKKRAGGTVEWTARFWAESHDLYNGKGVVMYPEGTRSLSPEARKPGTSTLADKHTGPSFETWWPCFSASTRMARADCHHHEQRVHHGRESLRRRLWNKMCVFGFSTCLPFSAGKP